MLAFRKEDSQYTPAHLSEFVVLWQRAPATEAQIFTAQEKRRFAEAMGIEVNALEDAAYMIDDSVAKAFLLVVMT